MYYTIEHKNNIKSNEQNTTSKKTNKIIYLAP